MNYNEELRTRGLCDWERHICFNQLKSIIKKRNVKNDGSRTISKFFICADQYAKNMKKRPQHEMNNEK